MKICTRCKEKKPLEEFYKQTLTRHSMCKDCKKEYNKERYWKQKEILKKSKW